MSVLKQLAKQRQLYAVCPNCSESFRLSEAGLFDATKSLPQQALDHLEQLRLDLNEGRTDLAKRKKGAQQRPAIVAEAVNIGKVLEKIVPSLPGFPVDPADCRALLEPIDYIVFRGLSRRGAVDSLVFMEAKSGHGKLDARQKQIKQVVERGEVALVIFGRPKEVAA